MSLVYTPSSLPLAQGHANGVDLQSISYNFQPGTTCAKNEINLTYGADSPTPLSFSTINGHVLVRLHSLTSVDVTGAASCGLPSGIRSYSFRYVPDPDTHQPQLDNVQMSGRQGSPEASTPLPIATYHYNSVTHGEGLNYTRTSNIAIPFGAATDSIASTVQSSDATPVSDQTYATKQNLVDVTGDGLPDLVFENGGVLWSAKSVLAQDGSTSLRPPVQLGDAGSSVAGPFETRSLSSNRFSSGTQTNHENVWRQAIDVNGDGRIDIIDAGAHAGQWTVYLNTPGTGPSNVVWKERAIPISSLVNQLQMYGHILDNSDYLPISRRFTGKEYLTDADSGDPAGDPGDEYTYTEWELQDINGDGLPDFVFNTIPAAVVASPPFSGEFGEQVIDHVPMPGPGTNSIDVMFDVGGIAMDSQGSTPYREMFSAPSVLAPVARCGVELWQSEVVSIENRRFQFQHCTFADINGDGIPERIEYGLAHIGLGNGYSDVAISLPSTFVAQHFSNQDLCHSNPDPAFPFQSFVEGGLRDLTGDGIPDLIVLNYDATLSKSVYVGNGVGFVGPIPMSDVGLLSGEMETCDGKSSSTIEGYYDIDGDGRPEVVTLEAGALSVYALTSYAPLGAGQLSQIDNGYGALTSIIYQSAKVDASTAHTVPFPEVVVSSVFTTLLSQPLSASFRTSYAYGNSSMTYDPFEEAFVFRGYGRTVTVNHGLDDGSKAHGQATVVDANGLADYVPGSTNSDRYQRQLLVGKVAATTVMSGSIGDDPWALLAVDTVADPKITTRSEYKYSSRLFEELAGPDPILDCREFLDPYDYDGSLAGALEGNDLCSSHGFMYQSDTVEYRGVPATAASVETHTVVLSVDDSARVLSIENDNDVYRPEDDLCVDYKYATFVPSGDLPPVSNAVELKTLWGCSKNPKIYSVETFFYDALGQGSVQNGLLTSEMVERHDVTTGNLLGSPVRMFDATFDASGNQSTVTTVREDGAFRTITYGYDPYDVARTTTNVEASGVPPLQSVTTLDAITLAPLTTTDENGTIRGASYDGFNRPLTTVMAPPGGPLGVTSTTSYLGFFDSTGRRVVSTTYDDPVDPGLLGTASGHISTVYMDEVNRPLRAETTLGSDYPGETLVQGYLQYDPLGRISFAADPFEAADGWQTAYGTTFFYNDDNTLLCSVRGTGIQPFSATTDLTNEILPTCYYHGFSNHLETFGVSLPDANQASSPQHGVMSLRTVTAIGRQLSQSTSQNGAVLDYATYTQDVLGNPTSMTRYKNPSGPSSPVTSTWTYDSFGQLLTTQDALSARQNIGYDEWGERTKVQWMDGTVSRQIVTSFDALGRVVHREEDSNGITDAKSKFDYYYDIAPIISSEVSPTNVLGRLAYAIGPDASVYASYGPLGEVNAKTYVDNAGTRYVEKHSSFGNGRPRSIELYLPDTGYQPESANYAYDSADRTSDVSYVGPTGNLSLFHASHTNAFGDPTDVVIGKATNYHATIGGAGRRLLREARFSSTAGGLRNYKYADYDAAGRPLTTVSLGTPDGDVTTSTTFDNLGRISKLTDSVGSSSLSKWGFAYDALGNITQSADQMNSLSLVQLGYGTTDLDQICYVKYVSGGTACNVVHDVVGNITSELTRTGTRKFVYFLDGHVKEIADSSNKALITYDPFGGVQDLSLNGSSLDAREDLHYGSLIEIKNQVVSGSTSQYVLRKFPAPGVVATLRGATTNWIFEFGDQRGMRLTSDIKGRYIQDVRYSPYGQPNTSGPPPTSSLYTSDQWNGGDTLAAFGLTLLRARVYDPVIGRFLQRDPLTLNRSASRTNPYAFSLNDPLNFSDPTGLDCAAEDSNCSPGLQWSVSFDFGGGGSSHTPITPRGGIGTAVPPQAKPDVTISFPTTPPPSGSATCTGRCADLLGEWDPDQPPVDDSLFVAKPLSEPWYMTMNPLLAGMTAASSVLDDFPAAKIFLTMAVSIGFPEFEWAEGLALLADEGVVLTEEGAFASRGLSAHGGIFSSAPNAAGGKVWTSVGKISQNDFSHIVQGEVMQGNEVNILTGMHGLQDGTIGEIDRGMYDFDMATLGQHPNVNVFNIVEMSPEAINDLVNGPGTIIGGFCNSGPCLAPFFSP